MKLFSFAAFAAALVLGPPLAAQAPAILEPVVERHQGPPLWISAESVADPEDVIDLDRIGSVALRMNVQNQRRALGRGAIPQKSSGDEAPKVGSIPLSECRRAMLGSDHRGGNDPSESLEDLTAYSRTIVRGTVRTIAPGFGFGTPTSLLEVGVDEVLKGPSPSSILYIDYPVAHFRIGPLHFCRGERGYEPQLGDQVVLFDYTGPVDRDGVLYVPRFEQLLFGTRSGEIIAHAKLKGDKTLAAVHSLAEPCLSALARRRLLTAGHKIWHLAGKLLQPELGRIHRDTDQYRGRVLVQLCRFWNRDSLLSGWWWGRSPGFHRESLGQLHFKCRDVWRNPV